MYFMVCLDIFKKTPPGSPDTSENIHLRSCQVALIITLLEQCRGCVENVILLPDMHAYLHVSIIHIECFN
jgi:hypothetical protein